MVMPDHLACLIRNLYAGQEATVRTGHGTTDWFQLGKGVPQGCILSLCLFNLYAEYIMRKAGLEEAQAGIKIAGRNINNLRYADDTTLMAESEEELKSVLDLLHMCAHTYTSHNSFISCLFILVLYKYRRIPCYTFWKMAYSIWMVDVGAKSFCLIILKTICNYNFLCQAL